MVALPAYWRNRLEIVLSVVETISVEGSFTVTDADSGATLESGNFDNEHTTQGVYYRFPSGLQVGIAYNELIKPYLDPVRLTMPIRYLAMIATISLTPMRIMKHGV